MNSPIDDVNPIDEGRLSRSPQQEHEFQAALHIRDWIREFLDGPAKTEWGMEPGKLDNVFIGTFAKGTKTFRAALLLCDQGYGQQAAMLSRSLFEHAVVSWWLLLCVDDEEEAMERLRQHRHHARVLFERALALHPELEIDLTDEPLEVNYIETLDERFGRFGGPWHGKRLDELVREIEVKIDERYESLFWKFFRLVNHHNNYTLHHSSLGISDVVRWESPDEAPLLELGPSPNGTPALFGQRLGPMAYLWLPRSDDFPQHEQRSSLTCFMKPVPNSFPSQR